MRWNRRSVLSVGGLVAILVAAGAWALVIAADKPKKMRTPDSVYVGTPHDIVMKMMDLAKITKDDVVYDLGCGDGRMIVLAAKLFGCRGVGYDIDPERVKECEANIRKHGVERLVTIQQEDIFEVDLRPASALLIYLLPSMNKKLIPQFEKLKDGSRIVMHDYGIAGIEADRYEEYTSQEDNSKHLVYLYTTPLKKAK